MLRTSVIVVLPTLLLLILLGAAAFFWWASSGWDGDGAEAARRAWILPATEIVPTRVPSEIKVMSWNIAFGGGLCGEPTHLHERGEVEQTLSAIAEQIRAQSPDLLFLQEVDRPSRRSGGVDQLTFLIDALGYRYGCYVTTWRVNYLPFPYWPPSAQLGAVHSGQAILSRFPIADCERRPLPQPKEYPWWYNRFFLHRSIQRARLLIGEGRHLTAVNLHLEAFKKANRQEQAILTATAIAEWAEDEATPMIVAGDLNALPANAKVTSGFADEETDFEGDKTVEILRASGAGGPGLRDVFLDDAPEAPEEDSFTFPGKAATRRLDYILQRGLAASSRREVLGEAEASDHLPILAVFPIPDAP